MTMRYGWLSCAGILFGCAATDGAPPLEDAPEAVQVPGAVESRYDAETLSEAPPEVAADGSTFERATERGFADLWTVESATQPVFPADALAVNQPGCALIEFRVTADGVPTDVKVVREWPPLFGFGSAAVAAVEAWRFAAVDESAAVPTRAEQVVAFGLRATAPSGAELEARCDR